MKSKPKLRVSDVGVLSVDSNDLARSAAGRKQIEALKRLTNRRRSDAFKSPKFVVQKETK